MDRVLDGVALAAVDRAIAGGVVEIACASVAHGLLGKLNTTDRDFGALAGATHGVGEAGPHGRGIARCTHGEAGIAEVCLGLDGVRNHHFGEQATFPFSILAPFNAVFSRAAGEDSNARIYKAERVSFVGEAIGRCGGVSDRNRFLGVWRVVGRCVGLPHI